MSCRPLRLFPALLLGSACGAIATVPEDGGPKTEPVVDASIADSTTLHDSAKDHASEAASEAAIEAGPACDAGSPGKAPNGGVCDYARILPSRGARECVRVGTFCDDLSISIPVGQESKLPAGFECTWRELGITGCKWNFAPGAHDVDANALNAVCQALESFPDTTIRCDVYL